MTSGPVFRRATDADLAAIRAWLREENDRTGEGFHCNRDLIGRLHADQGLFVVDVGGDPVAFLANSDTEHLIAEVRPNQRGRGYGRLIADEMVAQSIERGLSVIEIDCAPSTSIPFWRRMGFALVEGRRGYGGGAYAYQEIPRRLALGDGRRVPFAVRFYDESDHYRGGSPFRSYENEGEIRAGGRIGLPVRAAGYGPTVRSLPDCFVEVEIDGQRLSRDKAKRQDLAELGLQFDAGGVPYFEEIRLPG